MKNNFIYQNIIILISENLNISSYYTNVQRHLFSFERIIYIFEKTPL